MTVNQGSFLKHQRDSLLLFCEMGKEAHSSLEVVMGVLLFLGSKGGLHSWEIGKQVCFLHSCDSDACSLS